MQDHNQLSWPIAALGIGRVRLDTHEESKIYRKLITRALMSMHIYSEVRTAKRFLGDRAPWRKRHQRRAVEFYSQFISPGELCFDVGANVGRRTEVFLKLGARCVCIEPQQFCLRRLNALFENNPSVTILDNALGETEGFAEMAICEEAPSISTLSDRWKKESRFSKDHEWKTTQKVAVVTLDALIAQYGMPVFCKIDVEGYEKPVLRGLSSPIPCISFEFTREFFDDARQCIDRLMSIGPAEFNFSISETMKLSLPTWVSANELCTRIGSITDKSLQGDIYVRFMK